MSKKRTLGFNDLTRALLELSHLFSDTACKVLMALISRMDYGLSNTLSVISLSEIREKTAKRDQQILAAIKELESRGLLTKTSGKYHKEDARMLRAILYKREQKKMRSYYETNAYDLRGFVELVRFFYELADKYDLRTAIAITNDIREKAYAIEKQTNQKPSYIALIKDFQSQDTNIIESDTNILESDTNIIESDTNILESDTNICEKPPSLPTSVYHTHTPTHNNEKENISDERKENINNERKHIEASLGRNFQTESTQPIEKEKNKKNNTTATATATATMLTDKWEKLLVENEEFQSYVRKRIEEDPKVQSPQAVYESVKKKPDLLKAYYQEWQQILEQQKRSDKRVILIPKPTYEQHVKELFGDKYRDVIAKLQQAGRIGEAGAYVFILLEIEKVEKLLRKAEAKGIRLQVEEYRKEYVNMFKV